MKIAGINAIQYNNILRSNTDTKAKYSNTPEIPQDCLVKSTAPQAAKAQNISFGGIQPKLTQTIKGVYHDKDFIKDCYNVYEKMMKAIQKDGYDYTRTWEDKPDFWGPWVEHYCKSKI